MKDKNEKVYLLFKDWYMAEGVFDESHKQYAEFLKRGMEEPGMVIPYKFNFGLASMKNDKIYVIYNIESEVLGVCDDEHLEYAKIASFGKHVDYIWYKLNSLKKPDFSEEELRELELLDEKARQAWETSSKKEMNKTTKRV